MTQHHKFVNHAANRAEAVTRFMDDFFTANPADKVKLKDVMEIEFIGDLSQIEEIDTAVKDGEKGE